MKIALVSPWPDDRSGIADYTFNLALELSKFPVSIKVFTRAANPQPLEGVTLVTQPVDEWDLNDFDIVVYHFGNNLDFHGHMFGLLERFPGVVHLHDFNLQHYFAGMAHKASDFTFYLEAIARLYGEAARARIEEGMNNQHFPWEQDDAIDYPMCELVLERSQGAIVHSQFVRDGILKRLPFFPSVVIAQTNSDVAGTEEPTNIDEFTIGVFGHLQRNRCVDVLLKSLQQLNFQGRKIVVRIVGPDSEADYNAELEDLLKPIETHVQFERIGYVASDVFLSELKGCDVCVALRNPTLGETSAIVTRAMMLGKPTIVTDVGWYAELPDCVLKIEPSPAGVSQLANILQRMLDDAEFKRQIGSATYRFAARIYDVELNTRRYFESLHAFHRISRSEAEQDTRGYFAIEALTQALHDLQLDTRQDEANLRNGIYRKLAFCFEP